MKPSDLLPQPVPMPQRVYVLLEADVFERVKALLSDDAFDVRDTYAAQDAALAKVWDDPELDAYADCYRHRSSDSTR
ncbi:MAG: hypothetical protein O3C40_15795 [Planctomycetota bacterium]|nr:hypothetical protein [Planctomycetota bacterium]